MGTCGLWLTPVLRQWLACVLDSDRYSATILREGLRGSILKRATFVEDDLKTDYNITNGGHRAEIMEAVVAARTQGVARALLDAATEPPPAPPSGPAAGPAVRTVTAAGGFLQIPWVELAVGPAEAQGSSKVMHRGAYRGRPVAVLVLRGGSPSGAQALVAEAAVFDRLGAHPHLTKLHGLSADPAGALAIVTEYAPMGSLHGVLEGFAEADQRMSDIVAVTVALQVRVHVRLCSCVEYTRVLRLCVWPWGCRCAWRWASWPLRAPRCCTGTWPPATCWCCG